MLIIGPTMNKQSRFYITNTDNDIFGPYSLPTIKKHIRDGDFGENDHIGRAKSGPWKPLRQVPALKSLFSAENMDNEWEELLPESETQGHPAPPTPAPKSARPLLIGGVACAVVLFLVGIGTTAFLLVDGDRGSVHPTVEVYGSDARARRTRAEFLTDIAVVLHPIQEWLKSTPDIKGSGATEQISGDADILAVNDHLASLSQLSDRLSVEPKVGKECQRLVNILQSYKVRHSQLAAAIEDFTTASAPTVPYKALELAIHECTSLGVPRLRARAEQLRKVVSASRTDDSTLADLVAMEDFDFDASTSERPDVTGQSISELLSLAKFFARQKSKDAALAIRDANKQKQNEAIRSRNQKDTAQKALYLGAREGFQNLDQRFGSFTVLQWHRESPTYFVPAATDDAQGFRETASSLGLLSPRPSVTSLRVRVPLDVLSRLARWLDARKTEKEAADQQGGQQNNFLAATNVNNVLARLKAQVYSGFENSDDTDSNRWSSLMLAGTLKKTKNDDQKAVFLDVERVIVTRLPCRATASTNRDTIGLTGYVVTTEKEFDVNVMNKLVISPKATSLLGLDIEHLVPPSESHPGVKHEEYLEIIARGDENQIQDTNQAVRTWYQDAIKRATLSWPGNTSLEKDIQNSNPSAKRSDTARWARILSSGAGKRLFDRSSNILQGSTSLQDDVASAAFSFDSIRRSIPPKVATSFAQQFLEKRLVLTVSADGIWLVTGSEAVTAITRLLNLIGFYGDQEKEKRVLSDASAFYKKFTPTIRRPVIPPPQTTRCTHPRGECLVGLGAEARPKQ